jgi:S-adenosylmethionine synthetase
MDNNTKLITAESVTEGHPDKVCDQISDGILDAILSLDKDSKVAVECLATSGLVVLGGEVSTKHYVNVDRIVRKILKEIGYDSYKTGYDCDSIAILSSIHEQSLEISQGVLEGQGEYQEQGAGDQGLMYGYACNESPELMPLPIILSHKLVKKLADLRKDKTLNYLYPDGKSQLTVEYINGQAKRVDTVVIAACHDKNIKIKELRKDILEKIIKPVLGDLLDKNTKVFINATGSFTIGGPAVDTGLTGRKIIVDTYGGMARHGGGCFSGKDASKVDRSAAYMARYASKNIVAANLADKCELQVAYAIGVAEPVGLYIDTFGSNKVPEEKILSAIKEVFDFRPKSIIETLDLKKPIYQKTAAYGHFGRAEFPWERIDKVGQLKKYVL